MPIVDEQHDYSINLDVKFGFLELIDVPALISDCQEQWFNQTLCQVNDCVVRLGVMRNSTGTSMMKRMSSFSCCR
jgi:hypothetical protein